MTTVILANCKDDPRKISKTIESSHSVSCSVYGNCSIHNPSFTLRYFDGIERYNYAQAFGRYYWITDITLMPGKKALLTLREDVLMSHKDEILAIRGARVVRNEHVGQPLVYDESYPTRVDNSLVRQYFSNDVMNTVNYLVTVIGGDSSSS